MRSFNIAQPGDIFDEMSHHMGPANYQVLLWQGVQYGTRVFYVVLQQSGKIVLESYHIDSVFAQNTSRYVRVLE